MYTRYQPTSGDLNLTTLREAPFCHVLREALGQLPLCPIGKSGTGEGCGARNRRCLVERHGPRKCGCVGQTVDR